SGSKWTWGASTIRWSSGDLYLNVALVKDGYQVVPLADKLVADLGYDRDYPPKNFRVTVPLTQTTYGRSATYQIDLAKAEKAYKTAVEEYNSARSQYKFWRKAALLDGTIDFLEQLNLGGYESAMNEAQLNLAKAEAALQALRYR
ncbi:MAG: hypothetical protein KAT62_05660, partial [Desulfuromonadales bacterium]|nr:hypothetical protein [Desulfuromonadales bacterium]